MSKLLTGSIAPVLDYTMLMVNFVKTACGKPNFCVFVRLNGSGTSVIAPYGGPIVA